jgi:hypothetical protein
MSALAALTDRFKGQTSGIVNQVRTRLFGANNERLDFFMDSFYKLSPPQRTGVLAGFSAIVAFFVFAAIGLYFTQVGALKQDLSNSFGALHELQSLKAQFDQESKNYDKLIDTIDKKTKGQALKPFFEKIAQDGGITIEGLTDQKVPLPADNPLSEKVQEVKVEMRFPNISIPRMLNYLVEVEKANKYLRVQDLQIRGRYGTKLFFDGQAKIRGYGVGN